MACAFVLVCIAVSSLHLFLWSRRASDADDGMGSYSGRRGNRLAPKRHAKGDKGACLLPSVPPEPEWDSYFASAPPPPLCHPSAALVEVVEGIIVPLEGACAPDEDLAVLTLHYVGADGERATTGVRGKTRMPAEAGVVTCGGEGGKGGQMITHLKRRVGAGGGEGTVRGRVVNVLMVMVDSMSRNQALRWVLPLFSPLPPCRDSTFVQHCRQLKTLLSPPPLRPAQASEPFIDIALPPEGSPSPCRS